MKGKQTDLMVMGAFFAQEESKSIINKFGQNVKVELGGRLVHRKSVIDVHCDAAHCSTKFSIVSEGVAAHAICKSHWRCCIFICARGDAMVCKVSICCGHCMRASNMFRGDVFVDVVHV